MRPGLRRPVRPLRDVDVGAALDQMRAFMVARELDAYVGGCPWCGENACLTMTLFGPLKHAQVACSCCGMKALDEGGVEA